MSTFLLSLCVALLIAPVAVIAQQPMVRWKTNVPGTESECLARNGRWAKVGIPGNPYPPACTLQTSDSGRTCQNPEDCEGYCVVPNGTPRGGSDVQGTCSTHYPMFGCVDYLQDEKVISICRD